MRGGPAFTLLFVLALVGGCIDFPTDRDRGDECPYKFGPRGGGSPTPAVQSAICPRGQLAPGAQIELVATLYTWLDDSVPVNGTIEAWPNMTVLGDANFDLVLPPRRNILLTAQVTLPSSGESWYQVDGDRSDYADETYCCPNRFGDTFFISFSCARPLWIRADPADWGTIEAFCEDMEDESS